MNFTMLLDEDIEEAEHEFGVKLPDTYDRDLGCGCPECYHSERQAMRNYLEDLSMEGERNVTGH